MYLNPARKNWSLTIFLILFCVTVANEFFNSTFVWGQPVMQYRAAPCDNPLKGLVPYQSPFPGRFPHSLEFNYIKYSDLVKGINDFDWTVLESLLEDVRSRGNQTIFRVFLEYPGREGAIPQFLLDQGLDTVRWLDEDSDPPLWVITPDYANAQLRHSLKNFIVALGARYDGDPRIGYITAGLLGKWGEWHDYPRNDLWASKTVQTEVLTAYEEAFDKTPILLRYPAGEDHWNQASNTEYDFGYHDDSFAFATMHTGIAGDEWFFQTLLQNANAQTTWKTNPIGGEVRPEVWGCCHDPNPCTNPGQEFTTCRDGIHATWLMESGLFEEEPSPARKKQAILDAQKMGYEFFIESIELVEVSSGNKVLKVTIKNTGIAPFYHRGWNIHIGDTQTSATKKLNWELVNLLPGQSKTFATPIRFDLSDGFRLGIPNPMAGGKPLQFANERVREDGWLWVTE